MLPQLSKQNERLRTQVLELLDLLENHSIGFYSKKSDRHKPQRYEPDDALREKDRALREKLNQIRHYQREITALRKQLTESYNIERITEMENEVKIKQSRVKEL